MMNITDPPNGSHITFSCGGDAPIRAPSTIPDYIIVVAVVESLITLVGLLGNAVVIFVLVLAKDRQDTSSVTYVLNLAVADFCFLATVPFKISQMVASVWVAGEFMCKLAGGLITYLNFLVSPLFLMVMSIDRYLAVNKAVSSGRLRAPKTSKIVSIVVWAVAGCAVLPLAILHTTLPGQQRCKPVFPGTKVVPFMDADPCAFQQCISNYTSNAISRMPLPTPKFNSTVDVMRATEAPFSRLKRAVASSTTPGPKAGKKQRRNKDRRPTPRRKRRKNKRKGNNARRSTEPYQNPDGHPVMTAAYPNITKPGGKKQHKNRDNTKLQTEPNRTSDVSQPEPDDGIIGGIYHTADRIKVEGITTSTEPIFAKRETTFTPTDPDTTAFGNTKHPVIPPVEKVKSDIQSQASVRGTAVMESSKVPDGSGYSGESPSFGLTLALEACAHILRLPTHSAELQCIHADDSSSFHVWVIINFFYSYVIPCAIIVVCYTAILRKLYQPSGMLRGQESRARIRRQTMRKKVTLMVATLVISYIVCFTPYYVWQLVKFPGVPVSKLATCGHMERFNELMVYVNSALNPILYTFLSDQFGSKFKLAWRRMLRRTAHNFVVVAPRERNAASPRDESPANLNTPMIARDSEASSENCANHGASAQPIKTHNLTPQPIKTDQNLNVTMDDAAAPAIKITASPGNGGHDDETTGYASSMTPRHKNDGLNATEPLADSNMSLTLEQGEVSDGKRGSHQRHIGDDRQLRSSCSRVFICGCDCDSGQAEGCPQCVEEEEYDANDVFLAPCDVINDDVTPKASPAISGGSMSTVRARWLRLMGRLTPDMSRLRNKSASDRTNSSSSQKVCKKHKKQNRLSAIELKNARENDSMLDVGRWIYTTSIRSDSKYQTECTALTTPM